MHGGASNGKYEEKHVHTFRGKRNETKQRVNDLQNFDVQSFCSSSRTVELDCFIEERYSEIEEIS